MIKKETAAEVIRVLSVPPLAAFLLLFTLFFTRNEIYTGAEQLFLSVLFLSAIPIMTYPLSAVLPEYKVLGREGQRRLAFVLNFTGFAAAVTYGLVSRVSQSLLLIFMTYFLSVPILVIFNRFINIRASGHACGITGPLILLVHFIGGGYFLPCAALFVLTVWASLVLKRHTPDELTTGWISASIAFAISMALVSL
jgi:hypothetical protein